MYKLFLFYFSCIFLFACSNDKKEKQENPTEPQVTDTTKVVKPARDLNSWTPVDISPMDMAYFPVDYPKLKTNSTTALPYARVIYSRPHLQGRKLFDGILKYGEPWRLGANEATELDLYKPALIQGKQIKEGRYILYCIPEKGKWTIVLNSNIDSWGLHPDPSKDIARFVIPAATTTDSIEYFTILFREVNKNAALYMAWDNVEAILPVTFPKP